MTVRCPSCGTLYRRPARARDNAPTFRCARCDHVFDALPDEPDADSAPAEPPGDEAEDTFTDDDAHRFTFDETQDEAEDAWESPADEPAVAPRAEARAQARSEARSDARPAAAGSAASFAARMLVAVTLGYALLSAYLFTHGDAAYGLLADVPVIGSRLVERRLNPGVVELAGVRGEYLRVKGDELVFAIAGTAVNGASIPVRGVRVEGWVAGNAEVHHSVTVGARPREIRDLSVREIGLLQSLEPPNAWSLAPGETVPFLIVFPEPAEDLKEYGARVLTVHAARRS
jgi:predicted Zn finger-like uncharacterized protein